MEKKKALVTVLAVIGLIGLFVIWSRPSGDATATETSVKSISHAHGLAVDVADGKRLYIPTHHGLLVLKDDAELFRIGQGQDDLMGFSIDPKNPKIFYRSGHPQRGGNSGFQISEDGGLIWRTVSPGMNGPVDFHAMTVSPADPDVIFGWYRGELQRSRDGGKSWEVVNRAIAPVGLIGHPKDSQILYAVTQGGIMMSKDQGVSWQKALPELAGAFAFAIHPQDPERLAVSQGGRGVSVSGDGGKTWDAAPERFNGETILFLSFDPRETGTLYALSDANAVYKSSDAGKAWRKVY
jgi:photosystem II stability/assembly factor-like uncharacterized protein